MAHPEQLHFVGQCRRHLPRWFLGRKVLEIGSLDVNGSVRRFFAGCDYLGIDVGPGPGVDLVVGGDVFAGPVAGFDTVISCECFEHDPHWRETFRNGCRMLKDDGIMIVTCAHLGRQQHGTAAAQPGASPYTAAAPAGYYTNLCEGDFRALGDFAACFCWHRFFVDYASRDLYFVGLGRVLADAIPDAEALAAVMDDHLRRRNVLGEE